MNRVIVSVALVLLMASGASFATTAAYTLDSGQAAGGVTWGPGYLYALNIFQTGAGGAGNVIDQMQVAWGNLAPGTSATVVLYGMTSGSASSASLLQQVNTTVTSGQTNGAGLSFDGYNNAEHFYTASGPVDIVNTGVTNEVPATITNPVWSTYNITPTTITTPYFGVATIVYDTDPNTVAPTLLDTGTVVPGSNISWVGYGGGTYTTDLNNPDVANNGGYVSGFSTYGNAFGVSFGNNPYLIRADTVVPEPVTMTSLFLALGGLGAWVRRRAKTQA